MKNRRLGGVGFSEKDLSVNHKLLCETATSRLWTKTNVLRCMNRKSGCVVSSCCIQWLVQHASLELRHFWAADFKNTAGQAERLDRRSTKTTVSQKNHSLWKTEMFLAVWPKEEVIIAVCK